MGCDRSGRPASGDHCASGAYTGQYRDPGHQQTGADQRGSRAGRYDLYVRRTEGDARLSAQSEKTGPLQRPF